MDIYVGNAVDNTVHILEYDDSSVIELEQCSESNDEREKDDSVADKTENLKSNDMIVTSGNKWLNTRYEVNSGISLVTVYDEERFEGPLSQDIVTITLSDSDDDTQTMPSPEPMQSSELTSIDQPIPVVTVNQEKYRKIGENDKVYIIPDSKSRFVTNKSVCIESSLYVPPKDARGEVDRSQVEGKVPYPRNISIQKLDVGRRNGALVVKPASSPVNTYERIFIPVSGDCTIKRITEQNTSALPSGVVEITQNSGYPLQVPSFSRFKLSDGLADSTTHGFEANSNVERRANHESSVTATKTRKYKQVKLQNQSNIVACSETIVMPGMGINDADLTNTLIATDSSDTNQFIIPNSCDLRDKRMFLRRKIADGQSQVYMPPDDDSAVSVCSQWSSGSLTNHLTTSAINSQPMFTDDMSQQCVMAHASGNVAPDSKVYINANVGVQPRPMPYGNFVNINPVPYTQNPNVYKPMIVNPYQGQQQLLDILNHPPMHPPYLVGSMPVDTAVQHRSGSPFPVELRPYVNDVKPGVDNIDNLIKIENTQLINQTADRIQYVPTAITQNTTAEHHSNTAQGLSSYTTDAWNLNLTGAQSSGEIKTRTKSNVARKSTAKQRRMDRTGNQGLSKEFMASLIKPPTSSVFPVMSTEIARMSASLETFHDETFIAPESTTSELPVIRGHGSQEGRGVTLPPNDVENEVSMDRGTVDAANDPQLSRFSTKRRCSPKEEPETKRQRTSLTRNSTSPQATKTKDNSSSKQTFTSTKKLEVMEYAFLCGNELASVKFAIDLDVIEEWNNLDVIPLLDTKMLRMNEVDIDSQVNSYLNVQINKRARTSILTLSNFASKTSLDVHGLYCKEAYCEWATKFILRHNILMKASVPPGVKLPALDRHCVYDITQCRRDFETRMNAVIEHCQSFRQKAGTKVPDYKKWNIVQYTFVYGYNAMVKHFALGKSTVQRWSSGDIVPFLDYAYVGNDSQCEIKCKVDKWLITMRQRMDHISLSRLSHFANCFSRSYFGDGNNEQYYNWAVSFLNDHKIDEKLKTDCSEAGMSNDSEIIKTEKEETDITPSETHPIETSPVIAANSPAVAKKSTPKNVAFPLKSDISAGSERAFLKRLQLFMRRVQRRGLPKENRMYTATSCRDIAEYCFVYKRAATVKRLGVSLTTVRKMSEKYNVIPLLDPNVLNCDTGCPTENKANNWLLKTCIGQNNFVCLWSVHVYVQNLFHNVKQYNRMRSWAVRFLIGHNIMGKLASLEATKAESNTREIQPETLHTVNAKLSERICKKKVSEKNVELRKPCVKTEQNGVSSKILQDTKSPLRTVKIDLLRIDSVLSVKNANSCKTCKDVCVCKKDTSMNNLDLTCRREIKDFGKILDDEKTERINKGTEKPKIDGNKDDKRNGNVKIGPNRDSSSDSKNYSSRIFTDQSKKKSSEKTYAFSKLMTSKQKLRYSVCTENFKKKAIILGFEMGVGSASKKLRIAYHVLAVWMTRLVPDICARYLTNSRPRHSSDTTLESDIEDWLRDQQLFSVKVTFSTLYDYAQGYIWKHDPENVDARYSMWANKFVKHFNIFDDIIPTAPTKSMKTQSALTQLIHPRVTMHQKQLVQVSKYDDAYKSEIIEYAVVNGLANASKHFTVPLTTMYNWLAKEVKPLLLSKEDALINIPHELKDGIRKYLANKNTKLNFCKFFTKAKRLIPNSCDYIDWARSFLRYYDLINYLLPTLKGGIVTSNSPARESLRVSEGKKENVGKRTKFFTEINETGNSTELKNDKPHAGPKIVVKDTTMKTDAKLAYGLPAKELLMKANQSKTSSLEMENSKKSKADEFSKVSNGENSGHVKIVAQHDDSSLFEDSVISSVLIDTLMYGVSYAADTYKIPCEILRLWMNCDISSTQTFGVNARGISEIDSHVLAWVAEQLRNRHAVSLTKLCHQVVKKLLMYHPLESAQGYNRWVSTLRQYNIGKWVGQVAGTDYNKAEVKSPEKMLRDRDSDLPTLRSYNDSRQLSMSSIGGGDSSQDSVSQSCDVTDTDSDLVFTDSDCPVSTRMLRSSLIKYESDLAGSIASDETIMDTDFNDTQPYSNSVEDSRRVQFEIAKRLVEDRSLKVVISDCKSLLERSSVKGVVRLPKNAESHNDDVTFAVSLYLHEIVSNIELSELSEKNLVEGASGSLDAVSNKADRDKLCLDENTLSIATAIGDEVSRDAPHLNEMVGVCVADNRERISEVDDCMKEIMCTLEKSKS